jgi:hypothetical protein
VKETNTQKNEQKKKKKKNIQTHTHTQNKYNYISEFIKKYNLELIMSQPTKKYR